MGGVAFWVGRSNLGHGRSPAVVVGEKFKVAIGLARRIAAGKCGVIVRAGVPKNENNGRVAVVLSGANGGFFW